MVNWACENVQSIIAALVVFVWLVFGRGWCCHSSPHPPVLKGLNDFL